MQSDALLNFGFGCKTVYPQEKQYNLLTDEEFGTFLHLHYPEAEDLLNSVRAGKIKLKHYEHGMAAIGVFPELTLWLNFNKLTAMQEKCGLPELDDFYETLACLLLHEKSHYSLRHFRVPFPAFDHNLLNIAQDMVIDTRIHRKNSGWRNWQDTIEQINRRIDERQSPLPKISADPNDRYYLLNFSDLDIYHYLDVLGLHQPKTPPRFDEHNWGNQADPDGSHSKSGEGQNGQRGQDRDSQSGQGGQSEGGETPPPPPSGGGDNSDGQSDGQNGQAQGQGQGGQGQGQESRQDRQGEQSQSQDGQGEQGPENQPDGPNKAAADHPNANRPDATDRPSDASAQPQGQNSANNEKDEKNQPETGLPQGFGDIMDDWISQSRARLSQNEGRLLPEGADVMDEMMHVIACGKEHNLFNLLQKFIKKISYKQTRYTWKRVSKKQPYRKPGVMYKKSPGEVLLIIDTSGSMHAFINKHIADMANAIYTAFARMSRVYGVPSLMYKADVDDRVLNLKEIESVDELKEIDLTGGGGNDFEHIFDRLVLHWKEQTKSSQKFPDFILVLTDFGDDWDFLDRPEYKEVAERIIWLSTNPHYPLRPSKGYVVDVLSDDWSVSIR